MPMEKPDRGVGDRERRRVSRTLWITFCKSDTTAGFLHTFVLGVATDGESPYFMTCA